MSSRKFNTAELLELLSNGETHGKLTEVYGQSHGCKIDVQSGGCTESSQKLTESPVNTRKVDGWSSGHSECWRKVPRIHGKLTKGPTEAWKVDWSWRTVPRPHRKLTEGLVDARKVDKWSRSCTESWRKLTEGPAAAWNVYWRWHNVPLTHKNLQDSHSDAWKVDGSWWNVPWRTKSWWIVPQMHGKLTLGPTATRKLDTSRQKVLQSHGMFMEDDWWSCWRTQTWWKVPQPHRKLSEVKRQVQLLHKMFSTDGQKVDGSWWNILWKNGELERELLSWFLHVTYAFSLPTIVRQQMPTFRPAALAFFRANSKETNAVLSLIGMHKKSSHVRRH